MSQKTNTTRNFLRHYGEMVLAMYAGMLALGALLGPTTRDGTPELFALAMGASMTAPMVLWMRHRGHPGPVVIEMAAVMAACALVAVLLVWLSIIPAGAICALECGLMLPAMLGSMLVRRGEWVGERRPAGLSPSALTGAPPNAGHRPSEGI